MKLIERPFQIFPRQHFAACGHLGEQWQSYCDDNDVFCDRGDSIPVHLGYVERYRDQIVEFIAKKVKESHSRVFEYRIKMEV
jgi:acetylxylan esterase